MVWVDLTDLSGFCFGHISYQITCLLAVRMAGWPVPVEYVFGGVDEFSVLVAGLPGSQVPRSNAFVRLPIKG